MIETPEQLEMFNAGTYTHCVVCGRALSNPASKIRGMGPVCVARNRSITEENMELAHEILLTDPPLYEAVVIQRAPDGRVATNVPRVLVDHSPTGFEFGYAGSGPADLALNIAHQVALGLLPQADHAAAKVFGPGGDFKQACSREAYAMHQDLKFHFIATLDQDGAYHIPWTEVEEWAKKWMSEHLDEANAATF